VEYHTCRLSELSQSHLKEDERIGRITLCLSGRYRRNLRRRTARGRCVRGRIAGKAGRIWRATRGTTWRTTRGSIHPAEENVSRASRSADKTLLRSVVSLRESTIIRTDQRLNKRKTGHIRRSRVAWIVCVPHR
jgi:hypothetical protein